MPKSTTKPRPAKVAAKSRTKPYDAKQRKASSSKAKPDPSVSTPKPAAGDAQPVGKKAKKPKNKKKAQRSEEEESLFDLEKSINTAFAFMDPDLMSDYISQKLDWSGNELSSVEQADLSIRAAAIHDSTSFQESRTLENMPGFIEQFASTKDVTQAPDINGSPHTIVVAMAGLRAAEIVRALRKFQKADVKVSKCFAKHIKMEETVNFLNSHKTNLAVGTPKRLTDLVQDGALKVDNLDQLVIDASHIDVKKRSVLDMKETLIELCKWINLPQFKERYTDDKKPLRLLFY